MERFASTTLVLLSLLCVTCAASSASDESIIEVPFSFEKGYVTVQAQIKGKMPVEVILSTGAEHSTVDGGLLDKYKLRTYYSAIPPVTGHNDQVYIFAIVPGLRVGGLKEISLNMRFDWLADVSKRLGREIFGILGADYFKGRVIQFDFGKKVLRFLPQSPTDMPKDKQDVGTTSRVILPMRFYKEDLALPIVENVTFDGKKVKTMFDTGTVTAVSLSASATKQLGLTPPPEKGDPRADKVSSLRFGEHELTDVPVLLYPKGSGFDRDEKEFGAVVGATLLQNFIVTFDFRKKLIILDRM